MPGVVDVHVLTEGFDPAFEKTLRESADSTAETGSPDPVALAALRDSGLLALAVPRGQGGAGADAVQLNRAVERMAYLNPSVAIILFQHFAVASRIAEWGTPQQKDTVLPALADGTWLAASAWSEPGAGAAKLRLASTGRRQEDGSWLLDGAKSFTTGASVADVYLVLVTTTEGMPVAGHGYGAAGQTFFLVEAGNPGLACDLGLDLVGMRGSATGFVSLRGCRVDDAARLGPENAASNVIAEVRKSGLTLGAVSAGIAWAAIELLVAHLRQRGRLTQPWLSRLVELSARVESAHALVALAGARSSDDPGMTTLRSKLYASSAAEEICLEVARMFGSAGYMRANAVNQLLADARAVGLMGPANDLCRELVATTWAS
jgi:alkylation response protein AidB-like acyl-CoA dehydrogenase